MTIKLAIHARQISTWFKLVAVLAMMLAVMLPGARISETLLPIPHATRQGASRVS